MPQDPDPITESPDLFDDQMLSPELHLHLAPPKQRLWLHALLFLLTLATCTIVGARLDFNFHHDLPIFGSGSGADADAFPLRWIWQHPAMFWSGLPFSLCLLAFFLAHEFGHYCYCLKHKVSATLPFFLPFPTIIGMLGAVIKIRSPFRARRILFDIGVAGPIAGMAVAVPLIFCGLALSKPLAPSAVDPDVIFGTPLMISLARWMMPMLSLHLSDQLALIQPHPVLLAGWVGLFATALNLIPGGQLDGGHILYALRPSIHRMANAIVAATLILLGLFGWIGWLIWGAILFLPWFRHPHVADTQPLSKARKWTAALALAMFVLTFNPVPFHATSALDLLRQLTH